jgi:hypothetical protein
MRCGRIDVDGLRHSYRYQYLAGSGKWKWKWKWSSINTPLNLSSRLNPGAYQVISTTALKMKYANSLQGCLSSLGKNNYRMELNDRYWRKR